MDRVLVLPFLFTTSLVAAPADDGWISIFNGQTLDGWTANESPESFRVENGIIVANGERSHLFYTGTAGGAVFKDFELQTEVFIHPKGSSAIYFHAGNLGPGWTVKGLPVKITNTRIAETATGGIYYIPET